VKEIDSMPSISTLPEADAPRLSCPAHAPGDGDGPSTPGEPRAELAPETRHGQPPETYQVDRAFHAMVARLTGGISPVALSLAYIDWASHLAAAPQRRMEIAQDGLRSAVRFVEAAFHYFSSDQQPWRLIQPRPLDRRFAKPAWESQPFNLLTQAFLLQEQWWHNATTGVRGVAPPNEAVVEFSVRQVLDMLAPSNFAATNPEVLQKAFESGGKNFVFGWQNWYHDLVRLLSAGKPAGDQEFVVGETVASRKIHW
jgi:polyhydroxyalkanoate synthase subunit PhaC